MPNLTLTTLSDELADLAAAGAASVVQVLGAERPASGVVHGADTIITPLRPSGARKGCASGSPVPTRPRPRSSAGSGYGHRGAAPPSAINVKSPSISETEPRPGQIVLALARSWSNAVTARRHRRGRRRSAAYGRRRQISRVIRVTAPMHEGFAGGALYDASGLLTVSPPLVLSAGSVSPSPQRLRGPPHQGADRGTPRRGFVGLALQSVAWRRRSVRRTRARTARPGNHGRQSGRSGGLIVGDVLIDFDGQPTESRTICWIC